MSYDAYLMNRLCEACGPHDEAFHIDPTYNLTPIFHLALTGEDMPSPEVSEASAVLFGKTTDGPRGLRVLTGKSGEESIRIIKRAQQRLADPKMHERFLALEPENKWGTMSDATEVFKRMLAAAIEWPEAIWKVH